MLFRADGRSRIYRRHNERYATKYILEHDRFGSDIGMVWAGIHHDGSSVSVDVNGASRSTGIRLQHHIVPLIKVTGGVFQQDNARPHTARVCRDFLQQK